MAEDRLTEIEARLAEASKFARPWFVESDEGFEIEVRTADSTPGFYTVVCETGQDREDGSSPLAEFLARAPEDIGWLLGQLAETQAENANLREQIGEGIDYVTARPRTDHLRGTEK